ncbi:MULTISPECIES: efflux transporter outer membrane subunit [unclassified Paraburkholderia]|uniref:efflux transporter outer membrane subunit n=1 Tax=unclassified Paraburkholderia TaxID=2615204 RepID=UPI002AB6BBED|nr:MULTISPECIES: efflux transporter outer membrane subunit [unclassified Paraburkholderia]
MSISPLADRMPARTRGHHDCAGRRTHRVVATLSVCLRALFCAASLAGCAVGPDFSRPPAPKVDTFLPGGGSTTFSAAGASQTLRAEVSVRDDWWTQFGSAAIDTAVDDALTDNATLAQAQASLRRADDLLRAGAGVFYPQVNAEAGASRERYSPLHVGSQAAPSVFNLFTFSASISYAIDLWGGNRRYVEGLAAERDAQRYALEAALLTIASNVVNTMIARAAWCDEIDATQEMIGLVSEQVHIADERARAGTAAYAAVLTLQNEQATLEATLPVLEQKRAQAGDLLASLTGALPAQWVAPGLSLRDVTLPAELPQTVPSQLVRQRPDVMQAEALLHAASAQIGVATAAMLPNITLSAEGGLSGASPASIAQRMGQSWSLAADVAAPLFQGGTLWYGRKAAEEAYAASRAQYRQTVLSAFAQVADVLYALDYDALALDAQSRALTAAQEALQLLRADYRAGTVDYLQILIADGQLHQAQIAWLEAAAQRLQDTVALYAALGGGWRDDAQVH